MKTIEQHLQALFVGQKVKISYQDFINKDGQDMNTQTVIVEGVVSKYQIDRGSFDPDYHFITFEGSDVHHPITPMLDKPLTNNLIEIL